MELTRDTILAAVRQAPPRGFKVMELADRLELDGKGRHRLRRLLDEMTDAGEVERLEGARYRLPPGELPGPGGEAADVPSPGLTGPAGAQAARTGPLEARAGVERGTGARPGPAVGVIRVHPAGYGFVEVEGGAADVFVPARHRGSAIDGDRVRLATWMGHRGVEGRVEEILQRGRARLTGAVRAAGRGFILEPDDPRLHATWGHVRLEDGAGGSADGQCVLAEITRFPEREGDSAWARVTAILGAVDDPRTEVAKVLVAAGIPEDFPAEVVQAAGRAPAEVRSSDLADRVDLRDRPFLTIDPVTARDFDDAVCLEERPGGGHRLWVAVADVSHYVPAASALDREARVRGCSVYLPDRSVPMLPRELSSGICSLNPELDRLAMVARLDLDEDGATVSAAFSAAVIRSHARLDYDGVAAALTGDFRGPRARYREWAPVLERMNALARRMRERRRRRGSLDFDMPEAFVVLDEDDPRLVRDVRPSKSSAEVRLAYQLVEEYMLAANEAVAEFFRARGLDCVWRVHDVPDPDRLEEWARMAGALGVPVELDGARPLLALQAALGQLAGRPAERALSYLLLRSLKQATYDVVNVGHFGLASPAYLHFTSPIRRYPDLIVHRLLKHHLRREGAPSGGTGHAAPPTREDLAALAAESSGNERRAALAEREVVDMYRAFLMRDRVGEELEGTVSAVTGFGLFVECAEPFVEGLVRLDTLGDDRYELDEQGVRLTGRRSGRSFTPGMPVTVRVENVSVARRQIDLSLLLGGARTERPAAARGGGGRGERGRQEVPRRGRQEVPRRGRRR